MPIYEYKCNKCGQEYEALVMGSEDAVECSKCGSQKKERLLSSCSHRGGSLGAALGQAASAGGCSGGGGGGFS